MLRFGSFHFPSCIALAALLFLAGCATNAPTNPASAVKGISGSIHGGQQPISGASIQLYAVGTSGDGSAATPLLTAPVVSDAGGAFKITGLYTCPSATAPVYLTGTGGNPAPTVSNPDIALMAALGPCGSLTPSTFISVNEITTVAATYALAPYMSSVSSIGSASSDASSLASAFTYAGYFANTSTGTTPGLNVPPTYAVPVAQLNTIADILAACINSSGGTSGDGSVCGTFFSLTVPSSTVTPPTNTVAALLNLVNNPTLNTAALYDLIPPASPFQPIQPIIPPDLALRLVATSGFTVSPSTLTFAPAVLDFTQPTQTITVTNATTSLVNITSASITGVNASDFALVPQPGTDCAITVPANSSCTYQVSFTPSATGARAAYFVLGNTSPNPSVAVALAGTATAGTAGPVTLTPSTLSITQLGVPQTLTLTNNGTSTLSINAISLSSTGYTQTNNCGSSLVAGGSCTIDVSVPVNTSDLSATLTVIDDAATGPQTASLSFTRPPVVALTPLVDFGHWALGTVGDQFTIISTGSQRNGSFALTITGPNANDFSFSQTSSQLSYSCPYDNSVGSPCNLNVYFVPSAQGVRTAFVNIAGVGRFTLTGTADPAGPDFDFYQSNPSLTVGYKGPVTTVTFPSTPGTASVPIGTPSTGQFLVKNTGNASTITLNPPVISGPDASEFTVTSPSCTTSLAPSTGFYGCTPVITFTPTAAGTRTATLTYTDSTNTVTRTLTLVGIASTPAPVLTTAHSLIFSGIPVGTVSASQNITVTAYQNHPIQATITPDIGNAQSFVLTSPAFCPSTPCTLSLAYAPTSDPSTQSANVYLVVEDTEGLVTSNVQAVGQVAPLAYLDILPNSLNFGSVPINTVSAPQTSTLINIGNSALPLNVQLTQPSPDFSFSTNCPASLAVGASCTVTAQFNPVDFSYGYDLIDTGQGTIELTATTTQ